MKPSGLQYNKVDCSLQRRTFSEEEYLEELKVRREDKNKNTQGVRKCVSHKTTLQHLSMVSIKCNQHLVQYECRTPNKV
jgi:hypothetical protein